jgi:hypothetical protein
MLTLCFKPQTQKQYCRCPRRLGRNHQGGLQSNEINCKLRLMGKPNAAPQKALHKQSKGRLQTGNQEIMHVCLNNRGSSCIKLVCHTLVPEQIRTVIIQYTAAN